MARYKIEYWDKNTGKKVIDFYSDKLIAEANARAHKDNGQLDVTITEEDKHES